MTEFNIGDVVIIRDYEDMVEEYGADDDGDIYIKGTYFIDDMRYLCGQKFIIKEIDNGTVYFENVDGFDTEDSSVDGWTIITKMIRHECDDSTPESISEDDLKDILGW